MASTNERLQQAITAARAGNTEEARELVDGLVAENPDNPHALFLRGMLAGSEEEQLEYLNRVLEIDPDHKAANRRMEQLTPAPADDATVLIIDEPEEIDEAEAVEDIGTVETVVGAGALFAAEDDPIDEPAEEQSEWGVPETVVTAAAVGAGIEALEEDSTLIDAELPEELFLEEEPAKEEAEDGGLDEAIFTAAAATGVVMAGDEDEDIPDWLMAESRSEEELTAISGQKMWDETPVEPGDELPDWLTEDPSDTWADSSAEEATDYAATTAEESDFDDTWATEYDDQETRISQEEEPAEVEEVDEDPAEEDEAGEDAATEDEETEEADDEKPKKKSSTRGMEIALVILIAIALLIVIGLLYVVLNPPF